MLLPNVLVNILLSLYVLNPLYLVNDYIKDLQITSDPDTYLKSPQVIRRHGYSIQSYTILTEDGYLLELHRIPFGKARRPDRVRYPVLLCHGMFYSSYAWIMSGPNSSLAYLLADQGYDVWLPNFRGNSYSRAHVEYTPKQKEFWDYSVHELGVYDLPAAIDHVLLVTGSEQLVVVGHSLGTSMFFIMASTLPQYANKVKAQISLAAETAIGENGSSLLSIKPMLMLIYNFLREHTAGSFLEHDILNSFIFQIASLIKLFGYSLYDIALFFIYGFNPIQFNPNLTSTFASHYTDGCSIKLLVHFSQFWQPGEHSFANFDYGEKENLQKYGTPKPPFYNVSNISTPVRIYYGDGDTSATPLESTTLYNKLPNGAGLIRVNDRAFDHLDFIKAIDLRRLLNDDVIQFINNVTAVPIR